MIEFKRLDRCNKCEGALKRSLDKEQGMIKVVCQNCGNEYYQ